MTRCLTCSERGIPRQDIYAYNPTYEWTSHKTRVGMALSYLFPFMWLPTFGLRVGYTNSQQQWDSRGCRQLCSSTGQRQSICSISNSIRCHERSSSHQWNWIGRARLHCQQYSFALSDCPSLSVINDKISSGEFRIRALVSIESEQFDVERFHETGSGFAISNRSFEYYGLDVERFHETGSGFAISNRSFEYYGLPNVEVHSDIYMQARRISKEQRYIGSPPLPQTEINVLSLLARTRDELLAPHHQRNQSHDVCDSCCGQCEIGRSQLLVSFRSRFVCLMGCHGFLCRNA